MAKNGKWMVVVNGNEGKLYDEVMLFPWLNPFSPDGKKLAYIAENGG